MTRSLTAPALIALSSAVLLFTHDMSQSADTENAVAHSPKLVISAPEQTIVYRSAELLKRPDVEIITIQDQAAYPRQQMTFTAIKMAALLEGVDAPDDATVEFIALDGFASSIPLGKLRNTSSEHSIAYLAIEDPQDPWPLQRLGQATAGPFYLFWVNPGLSNIGREEWPYRINKIRVRGALESLYPEIVPAASLPSNSPAVHGYQIFVKNCLPCHTINLSGPSKVGPDLNYPMSPTEYFREDLLRKFIRDSQSVRANPNTSMGPFPEEILSETELDHLIAYLEHMASRRTTPAEGPQAP